MICIVGAGLAGDTAAAALRQEGYLGSIVLIGDEPERPYDRPPLSKEALAEDVPKERLYLRPAGWYAEQQVELRLGAPVTGLDPEAHEIVLGGERLRYDKLLLATGARARSLPDAEAAGAPVFLVRTLGDASRLRTALQPGQRAVVVGAGVIGLEVAASAVRRGCTVDVVELADRVLARVTPPELSDHMAALHVANGVRLHLGAGEVTLAAGSVRTSAHGDFKGDVIVVGIGASPNTALAEAAGLACRDGVLVDVHARTSDPDIYAVGDVARYPCPFGQGEIRCENWRHAQAHAAIAAKTMLGGLDVYTTASSMWSDQFDVKLQTVGSVGGSPPILRGDLAGPRFMLLYCDEAGVLVGAAGVNQAKDMRAAQRLIESRAAIQPERLADPGQDLRKLAA